jgi:hypothetical protein
MNLILISTVIGYLTFIWLKTNALYDYTYWILKKTKIFKEYEEFTIQKQMNLSFPDYIILKKKTFLSKLITCPICFSFWISVAYYRSIEGVCAACFSYLIYKFLIK